MVLVRNFSSLTLVSEYDPLDWNAERQSLKIEPKSKSLEGLIYEIRFNTCEKVVLHSRDRKILYKLKEAGCFSEEPVASVIDVYVNTKAY